MYNYHQCESSSNNVLTNICTSSHERRCQGSFYIHVNTIHNSGGILVSLVMLGEVWLVTDNVGNPENAGRQI